MTYDDVMLGTLVNIVLRLLSTTSLLVVEPLMKSLVESALNMLADSEIWNVSSPSMKDLH